MYIKLSYFQTQMWLVGCITFNADVGDNQIGVHIRWSIKNEKLDGMKYKGMLISTFFLLFALVWIY